MTSLPNVLCMTRTIDECLWFPRNIQEYCTEGIWSCSKETKYHMSLWAYPRESSPKNEIILVAGVDNHLHFTMSKNWRAIPFFYLFIFSIFKEFLLLLKWANNRVLWRELCMFETASCFPCQFIHGIDGDGGENDLGQIEMTGKRSYPSTSA